MAEESKETTGEEKGFPFKPWVVSTYFAEGFPYSVVRQISTVFFKDAGASLQAIGLTSLYGLPWVLKFLWGPLVDAFSTKRRWLVTFEVFLVSAVLLMAATTALPSPLRIMAVLFLVVAFLSATHDIAIDGFYLESLNKKQQAKYVGYQAMSYRLALIAGGGGVVAFSGYTSWSAAFLLAAGILGILLLYHFLFLPRVQSPARPAYEMARQLGKPKTILWVLAGVILLFLGRPLLLSKAVQQNIPRIIAGAFLLIILLILLFLPRLKRKMKGSDSFYARAFIDYLDQPKIGFILCFVLLYRTGESFLLNMLYPFLKDIGITRGEYGVAYGTFGVAASIIGGILGGHLISKYGLKRVIWPMVLSQNILNLLYMGLAWHYEDLWQNPGTGKAAMWVVRGFIVTEAFGAGLGTSVFMVFIMRTCKPAFKAAHFAIATSLMNISSTFAGVVSGFLAAWLGFTVYFGLTFLATLPGMALIFFIPYLDGSSAADLEKKRE